MDRGKMAQHISNNFYKLAQSKWRH